MNAPSWLQPFELALGAAAHLTLGPLALSIRRMEQEWQLKVDRDPTQPLRGPELELEPEAGELAPSAEVLRFGFRRSPGRAQLVPLLADRPVIVRAEQPFTLLPGEEVRAYVSTPLWVQLSAVDGVPRVLAQLPSVRPSDTWFGPNARDGVLCYASSTRLRLSAERGELGPNRVITPVVIRNDYSAPMELARFRLPVRHLSIFLDPAGRLWTERTTLRRSALEYEADVIVDKEAPQEAEGGLRLMPPREPLPSVFTLRAFEPLFRAL